MPLDTSHLGLSKFPSREDIGYERVMRRIQELVEEAPKVIAKRSSSDVKSRGLIRRVSLFFY